MLLTTSLKNVRSSNGDDPPSSSSSSSYTRGWPNEEGLTNAYEPPTLFGWLFEAVGVDSEAGLVERDALGSEDAGGTEVCSAARDAWSDCGEGWGCCGVGSFEEPATGCWPDVDGTGACLRRDWICVCVMA